MVNCARRRRIKREMELDIYCSFSFVLLAMSQVDAAKNSVPLNQHALLL